MVIVAPLRFYNADFASSAAFTAAIHREGTAAWFLSLDFIHFLVNLAFMFRPVGEDGRPQGVWHIDRNIVEGDDTRTVHVDMVLG